MQKWEYLTVVLEDGKGGWKIHANGNEYPLSQNAAVLDKLGNQGWELVGTLSFIGSDSPRGTAQVFVSTNSHYLYFKRPLAS